MPRIQPVVLAIIDGFGVAPDSEGNAITRARMPNYRHLVETYPAMTVQASGAAVGLSWGEMGNSEVGHITIGAGRIFYQSLPRINISIADGNFFKNQAFTQAVQHARAANGAVHLMGLAGVGGVHASQEHLFALLELCKREKISSVFVHAFLDGRDTQFNSGLSFIQDIETKMKELGVGQIATLSGRQFAMDRDNHWERVQKTYDAIALGQGETAASASEAIQASYDKKIFDEEFVPTIITKNGQPVRIVQAGDSVIFFNFRPDRARELTKAFVLPTFEKFPRTYLQHLFFATFTEYEKDLPVEVAYPPQIVETCLARVVSDAGLKQLHIAETEKYAHVTFFLNGMREAAFPGEDRVIIPSPRVSSYDQQPHMSALEIANRVVKEVASGTYAFIVLNFANPDMVGHTGNLEATISACETIDTALGQIVDAVLATGGALVITADHGNAEEVKNLVTGGMDKEHSTNPVPLVVVTKSLEGVRAPVALDAIRSCINCFSNPRSDAFRGACVSIL